MTNASTGESSIGPGATASRAGWDWFLILYEVALFIGLVIVGIWLLGCNREVVDVQARGLRHHGYNASFFPAFTFASLHLIVARYIGSRDRWGKGIILGSVLAWVVYWLFFSDWRPSFL